MVAVASCRLSSAKMANFIRVCHPADIQFMFEFDGKQFKGGFGAFIQDILSQTTRKTNVTFHVRSENDGFGEPIEGTNGEVYSGCIGLIQQNKSDVIFSMVNYPLPAINLTQGTVVMDSTLQFVNTYKPTKQVEAVQIESMFDSFSSDVWLLTSFILLTCICFLLMHERLRITFSSRCKGEPKTHPNQHFTYQVVTHFTGFGQLDDSTGSVRKIWFLVLSFFSFMIILYLSSLVKTDLVVVPPPNTMRSYQEMLDQGCSVWFFNGADTYQPFKSAAQGSEAKRLWDLSTSKHPLDQVIFDGQKTPAKLVLEPLIQGKSAFVTDSIFMTPILKELCALSLNEARLHAMSAYLQFKPFKIFSLFPLVSQDEKAATFLRAYVTNQYQSSALIMFVKSFGRAFESGLPEAIIKRTTDTDFLDSMLSLPKGKGNYGSILECVQNHLFTYEIDPEGVALANIANLPQLFACIMAFNFFLLFVELFISGRK